MAPVWTKAVALASLAAFATAGDLQSCLDAATPKVAYEGDPLYQATAVKRYNLDIKVSPAAVTFPQNAQEVAEVVRCAAENGTAVQAKSGGHSYANHGLGGEDGAVVVDLKNLQRFSMDTQSWKASFGSGLLLGDVTKKLSENGGRAMSHGTCPQVGSGGHFTIGGLGPTSRQFGAALDHIVEVEVVLANATIVRASENQNPDVFFAVKGAASGFAIVTEFVVRTEPEPGQAVQYAYSFTFGDTESRAKLFKQWQAYVTQPDLTRKLASTLTLLEGSIFITGTFFGSKSEYEALKIEENFPGANNASLIVFDKWLGLVAHWAEEVGLQIGGGIAANFYSKSRSFTEKSLMSPEDIDRLFEFVDNTDKGTALWFAIFDFQGGAINDVPQNATAFAHRDTLIWLQSYAINLLGEVKQETFDFLDRFNDVTVAGNAASVPYEAYPGYVDARLEQPQQAYWGSNLDRLKKIKAAIDPDNVFRHPQSVHGAK
ncbi:FAD-binding domain-containing protein [Aspergillus taichungensis]|uniref:FAD-binding domain-containing protein n=1 Tax=Aspergillus taichungensis TaxID=482145 RepID=A0A2J5HTE9_9EURO|nr:FAD-binding domain-containing protein [Aspergillus taichungensis]